MYTSWYVLYMYIIFSDRGSKKTKTEKIRRNKMEFVRFLVGSVFPKHCIQTLTNELSYLVKSFIVTEFHKIFNLLFNRCRT